MRSKAAATWATAAWVLCGGCGALDRGGGACADGPGLGTEPLRGGALPDLTLALTFDGGPTDATRAVDDYLYGNDVRATFFVTGRDAETRDGALARLKAHGHLVGNRGYTGASLASARSPVLEVRRTDELIAPHVTGDMFLLRSPGDGGLDAETADRLNAAGLGRYVGPIGWDVAEPVAGAASDAECWSTGVSVAACAQGYLDKARAARRGIVRLHAERDETAQLLRIVVPKLQEEGFAFVRIDDESGVREELQRRGAAPGTVGGGDGCSAY